MTLSNDILYRNRPDGIQQILLPKSMRKDFLRMCHVGVTGGHLGVRRTRAQARRRAHWFGWSKDTLLFCRSCEQCSRYRQGTPPKQARLKPVLCGAPWEILSIDVTGPHTKSSKGYVYILTMMNYFTKFVEIVALRNQEATTLGKAVVERFVPYTARL